MESESSSTLTEVFSLIWEVWKQRWLRKTVSKMSLTPSLKAFLQRGSAHKPLQILHHSFFIFTISHQTQKQATTDPLCPIALHTISWAFFTRCRAQKKASLSILISYFPKKKNPNTIPWGILGKRWGPWISFTFFLLYFNFTITNISHPKWDSISWGLFEKR